MLVTGNIEWRVDDTETALLRHWFITGQQVEGDALVVVRGVQPGQTILTMRALELERSIAVTVKGQ